MRSQRIINLLLILTSTLAAGTYSGGSGTAEPYDPYLISDLEDLAELVQSPADWEKVFKQTQHIDASTTQYWDDADEWHVVNQTASPDGDKYNDTNDGNSNGSNEGFPGIGTASTHFTGTYDGNNYTISNLTINRSSTDYVGFFTRLSNAEIDDITFANLDVTGKDYVGGLAGKNYGESSAVHNCDPAGTITGNSFVGGVVGHNTDGTVKFCVNSATVNGSGASVGGIVGRNYDGGPDAAEIHDCLNTGTITGTDDNVGGIAGTNTNTGTIRRCTNTGPISGVVYVGGVLGKNEYGGILKTSYNTGTVTGSASASVTEDAVGGLCGFNWNGSTITDCYNTGAVTGTPDHRIGGLVGVNGINSAQISNCFSTGTVTGSSQKGGLVYYTTVGSVSTSFWDTETSGQTSSPGGGTGKTTSEMTDYMTFTHAGWDFVSETTNGSNNYWDADQSGTVNNGYPILAWQDGSDTSLPVTLSDFTAKSKNGFVQLAWRTSSELENLGFILERAESEKGPFREIASYYSHESLRGQGSTTQSSDYGFSDSQVENDQTYFYRLSDISYDGKITKHPVVQIHFVSKENLVIPTAFSLEPAYPNPFNPGTNIRFELTRDAFVKLYIYDLQGRVVAELVHDELSVGSHQIEWIATGLAGGLYFLRMDGGAESVVKKLTLLK